MSDYYGTLAGFQAWVATRNIAGTFPAEDVPAALLVSSEWLDARYRSIYPGIKAAGRAQVRDWPRLGATDIHGYAIEDTAPPVEIENATYAATVREMLSPGALSRDVTPNKYKAVAVSGAVSVTYRDFDSAADAQIKLQQVDEILSSIICIGSNLSGFTGPLSRA